MNYIGLPKVTYLWVKISQDMEGQWPLDHLFQSLVGSTLAKIHLGGEVKQGLHAEERFLQAPNGLVQNKVLG